MVGTAHLHLQRTGHPHPEQGNGGWIDFWTICDTANCCLFFSDDNGHLYRAQTTLANFPNGFGAWR